MKSNFEALKNYRDKQKVTPELVEEYCGRVIDWLKDLLGVVDLSNIELFEIRRNVENVLKKNYKLASDFNKKNADKRAEVI
jgi:Mg/Co/Ni transporter MgtE